MKSRRNDIDVDDGIVPAQLAGGAHRMADCWRCH